MTTNDQLPDPQSLGYEEARDELVRIVQPLEGGQLSLIHISAPTRPY